MIGFPKHMNTKQDFLNTMKDYPNETKKMLGVLLEHKDIWEFDKKLDSSDEGVKDDKSKVVEVVNELNQVEKHQYKKVEDKKARLFSLGFKIEEVEDLLL